MQLNGLPLGICMPRVVHQDNRVATSARTWRLSCLSVIVRRFNVRFLCLQVWVSDIWSRTWKCNQQRYTIAHNRVFVGSQYICSAFSGNSVSLSWSFVAISQNSFRYASDPVRNNHLLILTVALNSFPADFSPFRCTLLARHRPCRRWASNAPSTQSTNTASPSHRTLESSKLAVMLPLMDFSAPSTMNWRSIWHAISTRRSKLNAQSSTWNCNTSTSSTRSRHSVRNFTTTERWTRTTRISWEPSSKRTTESPSKFSRCVRSTSWARNSSAKTSRPKKCFRLMNEFDNRCGEIYDFWRQQ